MYIHIYKKCLQQKRLRRNCPNDTYFSSIQKEVQDMPPEQIGTHTHTQPSTKSRFLTRFLHESI